MMIEVVHLLTHRGFLEADDIIVNMLGVIVGCGICSVVKGIRGNAQ